MGLYNMMFGTNPAAEIILATLGMNKTSVGRFRDAFVANGEIAVYTRLGGGNREYHEEDIEKLQSHPNYLRDSDDDFDCTYATFYYSFPEAFWPFLEAMDSGQEFNPDQRWADQLAGLQGMSKEHVEDKYPELAKLIQQIGDAVKG